MLGRKSRERYHEVALERDTATRTPAVSRERFLQAIKRRCGFSYKIVVVKYMGDTFLDLLCETQPGHPDKRGSPIPLEGSQREYLSVGRGESVAV